jgi:hypothetical protein
VYNFFLGSGATENDIESFITNINSGYIPRGKLEEKQEIDDQIKEADAILQTKNVKIKTINEYTKLNEKLGKHGLES